MAKADAQQAVDDQMVMTSFRISKDQARSLEIVSSITGRTKAELIRQALDDMFAELTKPEHVEALVEAHRERLLMEQAELRKRNLGHPKPDKTSSKTDKTEVNTDKAALI